jgi:hypothetical protein
VVDRLFRLAEHLVTRSKVFVDLGRKFAGAVERPICERCLVSALGLLLVAERVEGVSDCVMHGANLVAAAAEPSPEETDCLLDPPWVAAHAIHAEVYLSHVANAHVVAVGAQNGGEFAHVKAWA